MRIFKTWRMSFAESEMLSRGLIDRKDVTLHSRNICVDLRDVARFSEGRFEMPDGSEIPSVILKFRDGGSDSVGCDFYEFCEMYERDTTERILEGNENIIVVPK